jgi:hypothetical protein
MAVCLFAYVHTCNCMNGMMCGVLFGWRHILTCWVAWLSGGTA